MFGSVRESAVNQHHFELCFATAAFERNLDFRTGPVALVAAAGGWLDRHDVDNCRCVFGRDGAFGESDCLGDAASGYRGRRREDV